MKTKRILSALLCVLCALMLFSTTALAREDIDLTNDVTLTIQYRYDGEPIAGIPFNIYRIADVSAVNTVFTLTPEFEKYPVKLIDLDAEGWSALAETLTGFIQRDGLQPLCSGMTNSDGVLVFPNSSISMKPGLYLVTSVKTDIDGYSYTTKPFLVCLPQKDGNNGWDYRPIVVPKCSRTVIPSSPDETTRKVLKVWNDAGHEKERPQEITVQLLRNGEIYDTQTLTSQNQWRYTWSELSDQYEWRIVEKGVSDYSTLVSQEGITFVVTNTYEEDIPDEPTPGDSNPSDDSEDIPDEPVPRAEPDGSKLPKTGTTWYLVPILVCAGLLFLVLGLWRRRLGE